MSSRPDRSIEQKGSPFYNYNILYLSTTFEKDTIIAAPNSHKLMCKHPTNQERIIFIQGYQKTNKFN